MNINYKMCKAAAIITIVCLVISGIWLLSWLVLGNANGCYFGCDNDKFIATIFGMFIVATLLFDAIVLSTIILDKK